MKKIVLFLAFIASIFVACEQTDVDFVNDKVYGIWVSENNGWSESLEPDAKRRDLLYVINKENTKFISDDSIAIYHGYWKYTKDSDPSYKTYKYSLVKGKKLILSSINEISGEESTLEFIPRPDLESAVENFYSEDIASTGTIYVKDLSGKWEWVATENLDSSNLKLTKHVMDTFENTVLEFIPSPVMWYYGTIYNNDRQLDMCFSQPYYVDITKKDVGLIVNHGTASFAGDHSVQGIGFWFPYYDNKENLLGWWNPSGFSFRYSSALLLEKGELVLSEFYSDTKIIFKKIE